jgi:hypothetical protein
MIATGTGCITNVEDRFVERSGAKATLSRAGCVVGRDLPAIPITRKNMTKNSPLYPLRFTPIYQYRLWGGRDLADWLKTPLPGEASA